MNYYLLRFLFIAYFVFIEAKQAVSTPAHVSTLETAHSTTAQVQPLD